MSFSYSSAHGTKKRKLRRLSDKVESEAVLHTLKIALETDQLLTAQAKKLKLSKRKYASAAITYFAENGLDPTANVSEGLTGLNASIEKETTRGRTQAAAIGNRIISVMRTWEKALYIFLQEQQAKSLNYQEQIENTLHRQQTAVEMNLLSPLVSMLVKANVELENLRDLSETAVMTLKNVPEASVDMYRKKGETGIARRHVERIREFMETNHVAKPEHTPKPGVTPRPAVVEGSESMKTDKRQGIPLEAQVKKDDE